MKLIDKIKNIKVNSKIVVGVIILIIIGVIGYGINYCFYSPSSINKYIASNLYKTPANNAFDDDNFYQCVVDAYNSKNKTSLQYTTNLSDSQLKTITNLTCFRERIVSARGIEKLTSLTYLDVRYNQLIELDVSKNTALTTLSVSNNQLTSLDVSRNIALTSLNVDSNQLTSLDVSRNIALTSLYVSYNQLTSLDVSRNIALTSLNVSYNQLTDLNMIQNPELTTLDASRNQLTSLDVSKNTALTSLYVSYNQLTSLDVSSNIRLSLLEIGTPSNAVCSDCASNQLTSLNVSGATSLSILNVFNNQLTSLDVSQNPALTKLAVSDNQLTSLNVSGATSLSILNVDSNQLTSLDVSRNIALTELNVSYNQLISLDVSGAISLETLRANGNQLTSMNVSKNIALTKLAVSDNQLTSLDVSQNPALTELWANRNQLTSLDVSGAISLETLRATKNQLTGLDVSQNPALTYLIVSGNQLTSMNVSKNIALTELNVSDNQLTSLDVSQNPALTELSVGYNQLTSLDVSQNLALTELWANRNQLTSLNVSGATSLSILNVDSNQLTSLDVSRNIALTSLNVSNNQLTSLDVSQNPALTSLDASSNKLTRLDVSKNTLLETLYVSNNQLTNLDVSQNPALKYLNVSSNQFKLNLAPMLLGNTLDNLEQIVKLPEQLVPTITTKFSDGLEEIDDGFLATKIGTQNYVVTNKLGNYSYDETYYIEVVDIKSDKYNIDKTKDYIIVGSDDNDTILSNITIENGTAIIEEKYLVVKNGDNEAKRFKLIKVSSSVYDLSKDYIYVGTTIDEDIINNIETNAEISITDNILNINYGDTYNVSYKLVRLNTSYDISNDYIYTFDSNYLDNINVINGNKEIVDDDLVIKYNDIELDRIPILNISSDSYIIKEDYIYTGLSDIDLNKINKHNDLNLSINDNKLILTYKDNTIDEIPYYYLISNSNDVRFSTVNNKIYVKNTMMTYRELLQYIVFNNGGQSLILFDKNDNGITNNNLLIEEGSYITLYGNTDMKHIIEVNTEYVEYKIEANVHYTDNYGIDIIKNLNNNNTFINVKDLIETDGNLSIFDKEDNMLEDTSNIKTGDKVIVTFPSSNKYYIYLSVKGDVTGKGIISNDDVLEAYSILRGKKVEDYYRFASDVTNDGQIRINDIAKLYHYVNNKIESLD